MIDIYMYDGIKGRRGVAKIIRVCKRQARALTDCAELLVPTVQISCTSTSCQPLVHAPCVPMRGGYVQIST